MLQPDLTKHTRKVLLVGWDAADWKVINPLLDAGKMPNLEKLVEGGVIGNLATLSPDLSPMLWTSIATGKRPFKHGILGFAEPTPSGDGVRPITNLARKCRAIWNMLTLCGLRCHVAGWWPSHPVEPISGVMISNRFHGAHAPHGEPWPIPPGTVHPERILPNLEKLRTHPQDLDPGLVKLFVPDLFEIDQEKDKRIESLAKTMAESITIRDAMCAVLHHEPWHFGAVYFDAIDHFCHGFMRYHPPRLDWVPEKDYNLYHEVIEAAYRLHDVHLGMLMQQVPKDGYIMLISDHGFHSDHLRPRHVPNEPAGPAVQHRPYGIFVLSGPDLKQDERIYGAGLLDICPTILSIYGLPMGEDMDGKPLVNAFTTPSDVLTIPSWEEVQGGADGAHSAETRLDPVASREALQQLVDLGYINPLDDDRDKAVADTVRELEYNLARSYMDAGKAREGFLAFREERGEEFDVSKLDEREQRKLHALRARAFIDPLSVDYLMGTILMGEGQPAAALESFNRVLEHDKTRPHVFIKVGDARMALKEFEEAATAYQEAVAIDQELHDAHLGLARSYLRQRQNLKAADSALSAVALRFHNPMAHFVLGVALHRLHVISRALEALELAVAQNPNFPEAHIRLAYIYGKRLGDRKEARKNRDLAKAAAKRIRELKTRNPAKSSDKAAFAETARTSDQPGPFDSTAPPVGPGQLRETVIIVTGLPRSGTSMMMQMLRAGGVPLLTDEARPADESNPRGYFEYEKSRALRKDNKWITEARGHAVKIVGQLLPALPSPREHGYRVIFMERNLGDVVRSQNLMLGRQGKVPGDANRLAATFSNHLTAVKRWLAALEVPVLTVAYADAVTDAVPVAQEVNRFLGGALDETAMAAAVDPALHRVKAESGGAAGS